MVMQLDLKQSLMDRLRLASLADGVSYLVLLGIEGWNVCTTFNSGVIIFVVLLRIVHYFVLSCSFFWSESVGGKHYCP